MITETVVSAAASPGSADEEFSAFAAVLGPRLFRSAVLLCGDWQLAEDLVQTTLAKVYVSWRRVSRADRPESYAHGILTKTFLSHRRLRRSSEVPDSLPSEEMAARLDAPDVELRLDVLNALAQLEPADRAVLVLRYWEDRSVAETASVLGISDVNVRSRASRAAARLRAVLDDPEEERS